MDERASRQLAKTPDHRGRRESVGDDTEAIRRQIEASRHQIANSLQDLRSEVSTTVDRALDWRQWVRDRPHTAVGIAFGLGLYLGLR